MARLRVAPLVALAACVLASTAAAAGSPSDRMASIAKTAHAQQSVHYLSVHKEGVTSLTIDADVGPTAGIQRITYRDGAKSGRVTVIVARRTAYLRGDTFALREFLGFPVAASTKFANTWLRIRHSSSAYTAVADDVTFDSILDHLTPTGKLVNVARTKLAGQSVVGVRTSTKVRGGKVVRTIWVAASGKPLLASQTTTAPGVSLTVTYSAWNKPVNVSAPRDFIDADTGKASGTIA